MTDYSSEINRVKGTINKPNPTLSEIVYAIIDELIESKNEIERLKILLAKSLIAKNKDCSIQ